MLWARLRAVNELGGGRLPRLRRRRLLPPQALPIAPEPELLRFSRGVYGASQPEPRSGDLLWLVDSSRLLPLCAFVCVHVSLSQCLRIDTCPRRLAAARLRGGPSAAACADAVAMAVAAARWTGARRDSARGAYSSRNPSDVLASTMIHVVPQGWLPANDEPMPQRLQPLRR